MKALIYIAPQKVAVKEVPEALLKDGQVKIRIIYCGICGSDITIFSGRHPRAQAPLVIGHEFVGIIEETKGTSGKFKIGDRVTPYPLLSCGKCLACNMGTPHVCEALKLLGIDIDGGAAQYINCDEDVLFAIPDGVSDKAASVIEPLAVIVRAIHSAKMKFLDSVIVIGAGPIGLLSAIVARKAGASKVIISDIDQARLDLAKQMGFDTVDSTFEDLEKYVLNKTNCEGADIVFECSGVESSSLMSTKICRIRGTICMTATHKIPHQVNLQDINFKEQMIVGSRVYTKREFGQAVAYSAIIGNELERLVTNVVSFEEAENVFKMLADPNVNTVKVIVDCE